MAPIFTSLFWAIIEQERHDRERNIAYQPLLLNEERVFQHNRPAADTRLFPMKTITQITDDSDLLEELESAIEDSGSAKEAPRLGRLRGNFGERIWTRIVSRVRLTK
jgi:hypothetical protein